VAVEEGQAGADAEDGEVDGEVDRDMYVDDELMDK
jgi:hypothetical protein